MQSITKFSEDIVQISDLKINPGRIVSQALCGKGAGKKLIVIRVIANRLSQTLNRKNFRVGCDQIKDGSQHNRWKLPGKYFSNSSIFIENIL